jgi:hypothetical protein
MDNERTYTEEEVRRREREAFCQGAMWRVDRRNDACPASLEARRRFPITKRVPRVLADEDGTEWRITENGLEWRNPKIAPSYPWSAIGYSAERLRVWEDLRQSPTVEVDG